MTKENICICGHEELYHFKNPFNLQIEKCMKTSCPCKKFTPRNNHTEPETDSRNIAERHRSLKGCHHTTDALSVGSGSPTNSNISDEVLKEIYPRMSLVKDGQMIFCKRDLIKAIILAQKQKDKAFEEFVKELKENIENNNAEFGNYSLGDFGTEIALEIIDTISQKYKIGNEVKKL